MAVTTQVFYTQDGNLPEDLSLWELATAPEPDSVKTVSGVAAGLYYVKLRNTDGVNYSDFSSVYTVTVADPPEGNTTPAAPAVTADDTANTLDFSHALGDAEIVVSVNGGAYGAMTSVAGWNGTTGKIDVGEVARAAGYWKAKTKAATGRNESAVTDSPAFTVAGTNSSPTLVAPIENQPYSEGFGSFALPLAGVFADADGEELTYSVTNSNTSISTAAVDNTSDTLTITEVSGRGDGTITIKATDGSGAYIENPFALKVRINPITLSPKMWQEARRVDTSDPAQVTLTSGVPRVIRQYDLSGNGRDLVQDNADVDTYAPIIEQPGKHKAYILHSASRYLHSALYTASQFAKTSFEQHFFFDIDDGMPGAMYMLVEAVDSGTPTYIYNVFVNTNGSIYVRLKEGTQDSLSYTAPVLVDGPNTKVRVTAQVNWEDKVLRCFVNGVEQPLTNGTITNHIAANLVLQKFSLGARTYNGVGSLFKGKMYAHMITPILDSTQRANLDSYFNSLV